MADEASDYCDNYDKAHRRARQLAWLKCVMKSDCAPDLSTLHVTCDIMEQLIPKLPFPEDTEDIPQTTEFIDSLAGMIVLGAGKDGKNIEVNKLVNHKMGVGDAQQAPAILKEVKDLMDVVNACMPFVVTYIETKWTAENKCGSKDCDKYLCPSDYN